MPLHTVTTATIQMQCQCGKSSLETDTEIYSQPYKTTANKAAIKHDAISTLQNYSLIILISNQIYIQQCCTPDKMNPREYSILGFKKKACHACV